MMVFRSASGGRLAIDVLTIVAVEETEVRSLGKKLAVIETVGNTHEVQDDERTVFDQICEAQGIAEQQQRELMTSERGH